MRCHKLLKMLCTIWMDLYKMSMMPRPEVYPIKEMSLKKDKTHSKYIDFNLDWSHLSYFLEYCICPIESNHLEFRHSEFCKQMPLSPLFFQPKFCHSAFDSFRTTLSLWRNRWKRQKDLSWLITWTIAFEFSELRFSFRLWLLSSKHKRPFK